jgi:hypothetical protein
MNIKHFRNQTDLDLSITLIVNQGLASSTQTEITHTFQIKAKESKKETKTKNAWVFFF